MFCGEVLPSDPEDRIGGWHNAAVSKLRMKELDVLFIADFGNEGCPDELQA